MISLPENYKTTITGIVVILSGVIGALRVATGDMSINEAWPLITAAIAGIGLIFSRDAKPTDPPPVPPRGI
jgi:hypothetical protein